MNKVLSAVRCLAASGILAICSGGLAQVVFAQPAGLTVAQPDASDALLLAGAADLKGKPPYKRTETGKPEMEKGQFARFEEKPGDMKENRKSIYNGVAGDHPPFNRNR